MATKTATMENQLEKLAAERDRLQAALADLQAQRAAHAEHLEALQAEAEREGSPDALQAAETAENHDHALALQVQRKQAALRAVGGDIAKAQRDLEAAQRAEKEARLANLRGLAGKTCDRLEKDLADSKGWQELQRMHDEARGLVTALHGQDALAFGRTKDLWAAPVEGLRTYLHSVTMRGVGLKLATVAGAAPTLSDPVNIDKLPLTLRQSMEL